MFLGPNCALAILSGRVAQRLAQNERVGGILFGLRLIFGIASVSLFRSAFLPKAEGRLHWFDRVLRGIGAAAILLVVSIGKSWQ